MTCAVYGDPDKIPITEDEKKAPVSPYGRTKLMVEQILQDIPASWKDFKFAALRYFNASGCAMDGTLGEDHDPEPHLIPVVLQAILGLRPGITVFGTDYPTPDGTAIRDYVHVSDLAEAHVLALDYLRSGGESQFINLGSGHGYSVLEVIDNARKVTGHPIPIRIEARRAGDPARLVADAAKAQTLLGWVPELSDLPSILRSQWEWRREHPRGYNK